MKVPGEDGKKRNTVEMGGKQRADAKTQAVELEPTKLKKNINGEVPEV